MSNIRKKLFGKKTGLDLTKSKHKLEAGEEHPAAWLLNYHNGDYLKVEITTVQPNPKQPRQYFDPQALAELSSSIKEKGVLQPVIVTLGQDKKTVYLVAGERRLRAAKMAGLTEIPAIFSTGDPAEIALIENVQREDLSPIEEAEAMQKLMEEHRYTQDKLASIVGKARTTINEYLSLNRLTEEIKAECRRADTYPKRLLVEVAKQKTEKEMVTLFTQIKEGNFKSEEVRTITRKRDKGPKQALEDVILHKAEDLYQVLLRVDFQAIEDTKKAKLKKLKKVLEEIAE